jgi:metal-responsive CopG/Arc/MetJ family transcriptional regulator
MKPPTTERLRLRRPKGSGQYPVVPVRLPPDLLVAIDKLAAKIKSSRSEAVRLLIEAGLKRKPPVKTKD